MENEIRKIVDFIRNYVQEDENVVIPVSGGLDSDVVARLCFKALGKEKIKLFIVTDNTMEKKFLCPNYGYGERRVSCYESKYSSRNERSNCYLCLWSIF